MGLILGKLAAFLVAFVYPNIAFLLCLERCNELLEQKNAVIRDLMTELEAADLRFVKDQERQLQEVSLLVQRIESQVKIMQEAYRRELSLIEVFLMIHGGLCFT